MMELGFKHTLFTLFYVYYSSVLWHWDKAPGLTSDFSLLLDTTLVSLLFWSFVPFFVYMDGWVQG